MSNFRQKVTNTSGLFPPALMKCIELLNPPYTQGYCKYHRESSFWLSLNRNGHNLISRDISELSVRWMLLTLKVTEGLQGLQAITWPGLRESTHIPKAKLVLPPSSGEWKQPLGRVNLLHPTLSPHHTADKKKKVQWQKLKKSPSVNLSLIIWNASLFLLIKRNTWKRSSTCVLHQRGQSAKMLALLRSRKRLSFRILCKTA